MSVLWHSSSMCQLFVHISVQETRCNSEMKQESYLHKRRVVKTSQLLLHIFSSLHFPSPLSSSLLFYLPFVIPTFPPPPRLRDLGKRLSLSPAGPGGPTPAAKWHLVHLGWWSAVIAGKFLRVLFFSSGVLELKKPRNTYGSGRLWLSVDSFACQCWTRCKQRCLLRA